jgi:hypothetical protein
MSDRVSISIDGDGIADVRLNRPDKLNACDLERNPRPRFFLPPAMKSPHLWVGTLPANPAAGTYAIEVRATDMYGQVFRAHRVIRIESR